MLDEKDGVKVPAFMLRLARRASPFTDAALVNATAYVVVADVPS